MVRSMLRLTVLVVLLASGAWAGGAWAGTTWLDEMDLSLIRQGWGTAQPNHSVQKNPLILHGRTYARGVGSHASAAIYVVLDGRCRRFQATVGVDDEVGNQGTITVTIHGGDKPLLKSGVLRGGQDPLQVDLDVSGVECLRILVGDAGDGINYDHVDLADARFEFEGNAPSLGPGPPEEKVLLTPPPPAVPRINGAKVLGVRPTSPFLYRIPATGERPMKFGAEGLPAGLGVDPEAGIITGRLTDPTPRTYRATLSAQNSRGKAQREFRIVVGDTLALTPPMGWNHWYAHYNRVTDAMVRQAADVMISSGMADVGYQYVNIDDCWMNAPKHDDPKRVGPGRDPAGNLIPNSYFPDMLALTDYIHAKGLKAGVYISPGPLTCACFTGSWEHEEQDARQFAEWGFDFLKYDWCSYGEIAKDKSLDEYKKPYIKMGTILRHLDRDIVFNLCQYGMGEVWKWGAEVGGNCWRTAGDLGFELSRYHEVARRNAALHAYARPGAWNDPDYLLLGCVGDAGTMSNPKACPLTPNEQYSYMSLWCLMAAPLIFSGDMSRLDPFTLNVLCNPEVIEINQDPLGKQGYPVAKTDLGETWKKELEDGAVAVGLFNLDEFPRSVAAKWADIGVTGKQRVRDLWRQQDLGVFDGEFSASVGRHGIVLLRFSPAS